MNGKSLLEKGRRRAWREAVTFMRERSSYPLLYRSWWHSRLAVLRLKKPVLQYLAAVPNPGAGIGHQMANWNAGLWYARQFDLVFAHIPFASGEWEQLLGFGQGEPLVAELLEHEGYSRVQLPLFREGHAADIGLIRRIVDSYSGRRVVFILEQDQPYRDQFGVIDAIQQKFYNAAAGHRDRLLYVSNAFNIAIHVRRGDIVGQATPNLAMRWQDNDYFEAVLQSVTTAIRTSNPIKIYLFSQGQRAEFVDFDRFGDVTYCLDMGAQESFLHMAFADLLITSKSSFSYKPALLSRGVKICPRQFWHGYPAGSDWLLADDDGRLDQAAIKRLQRG